MNVVRTVSEICVSLSGGTIKAQFVDTVNGLPQGVSFFALLVKDNLDRSGKVRSGNIVYTTVLVAKKWTLFFRCWFGLTNVFYCYC